MGGKLTRHTACNHRHWHIMPGQPPRPFFLLSPTLLWYIMCVVLWMYGVSIPIDLVSFVYHCQFDIHYRPERGTTIITKAESSTHRWSIAYSAQIVTDEFNNNALECYFIQNQTACTSVKLYILQSHMTLFNILVLVTYIFKYW